MGNDNGGNGRFAYREHLSPELREEDERIHAMMERFEEEARQQQTPELQSLRAECKRLHHLVQEREDSYHQQGRMLRQMWAENRQLRQQLDALRAKGRQG
jgi:tRNA(Ile)-lysidine synthase TilS/MesJ